MLSVLSFQTLEPLSVFGVFRGSTFFFLCLFVFFVAILIRLHSCDSWAISSNPWKSFAFIATPCGRCCCVAPASAFGGRGFFT